MTYSSIKILMFIFVYVCLPMRVMVYLNSRLIISNIISTPTPPPPNKKSLIRPEYIHLDVVSFVRTNSLDNKGC